jgi:hypothetical protein
VVVGRGREGVEQLAELGELEGLGEIGERTVGEEAADDTRGGISGQDHHGDGRGDRFGPELFEHLFSVQIVQVEIEENEVGNVPDRAFDAVPAGPGGVEQRVLAAVQELGDHLDVHRIVLDVQDPDSGSGRGGRPGR